MSVVPANTAQDRLKNLGRLQDIPIVRQLGVLAITAAAIALGLWLFFWTQKPDFVPVFAGLDAKSTTEASELLRTANIPFKIDSASGALAVPQEQLGQAKLALAAAGLPASQDKGFELMQGDQGFGTSQFVENARYQHALETELARTIAQLRPVREARVHLALPKPSAFTRQKQPASASVVLQMQAGSALEAGQVDAIVHLVASSIPDLAPDRVTVVDQFGRMLSNPDPDSDAARGAKQFEQQRRQEAVYVQRIQELLEPMTGPGRVSAQVSVDMDFSQTEEAREIYGQDPARVRSEQISENGRLAAAPGAAAAQGVPGSASNTPDPTATTAVAAAAPAAADGGATSRTAVRNYELDRTLTHTRQATGRIRRVTAAVLVDNLPGAANNGKPTTRALNGAELARIQTLVQQAIGFDAARGDAVSVVNAPFATAPLAEPEGPPLWEKPGARDMLRTVLGGLAVLLVIWVVLRPAFRQLLAPKQHYTVATVIDEPMPLEAPEPVATRPTRDPEAARKAASFEEKLDVARTAVNTDPKRVAQVVRDLVESDG